MNLNITFSIVKLKKLFMPLTRVNPIYIVLSVAFVLSLGSALYFLKHDLILAYGDAESHLNISKRVIQSITPGFAQLGGIWLPFPHLMMIPFVWLDPLWRSGLAGSIVSGMCFIISSLYVYRLTFLLTRHTFASFAASLVFMFNPNILYLQATPMTEMPLIMFFLLSSYYFIIYIKNERKLSGLLLAAFFGFCAVLTRYDGWFLVLIEALTIVGLDLTKREHWQRIEGKFFLFSTLAFFGAAIWMMWDFLILGDPFYFTTSEFSARSQQMSWMQRGELPAYHNLPLSFLYYFITGMSNSGILMFALALTGLFLFFRDKKVTYRYAIGIILLVPVLFNTFTLFMGQSVIFIPHLTPVSFEWRLFNVRYGALIIPVVAFLCAYAFYRLRSTMARSVIIVLFFLQFGLYMIGYSRVITIADGTDGLSRAKRPDAERFISSNYDKGLVLIDDYARTLSILRSGIPMQKIIYVGNKPYWQESLKEPEKYATWIIMQKDDTVWKNIYDNPVIQGRLYAHFQKVYTSPQILIFKRFTP
ncbi:hypothetical protein HGB07_00960 [Candidatus Roizmanbacteria bacterium]|nr:hypothetical protein [Candidatus Roizmanbacteria bacterium]